MFKIKKIENSFLLGTLVILLSGLIVKALGLINKIVITRLLGTEGMSIYILAFPTIILFINLAGFSLNITTSKLIAESLKNQRYSPKKIIKNCLKIAIIVSLIIEMLFLISLRFIVYNLLKNNDLFYPLLMIIFLIPLVGITDTFRGIFAGYKKMNIVAKVNILEQVTRILFSVGSLIILSKYGTIISVSFTILALTIGEASSLIYLLFKYKKLNIFDFTTTSNEKKAILNMAIPTTASRLIGSFTYFLEPIVNTFTLLLLNYENNIIKTDYTIINAYIIPLLTITSFLSTSLSTTCIPAISEQNALNQKDNILKLINKVFIYCIIPGLLVSIILYSFPTEYMNFLFATSQGSNYIKKFVFIYLIHYLQAPGIAILQALGYSKKVFKISTIFNILRIIFIILLSYIPFIGTYAIFYSITITMFLETLLIWLNISKYTKFKLKRNLLFNLALLSIIMVGISTILINLLKIHFIIITLFIVLIYFILIKYLKIIE